MEPVRELLYRAMVGTADKTYELTLHCEDFSALYPGMLRYVLTVSGADRPPAVYITNTYEYSPLQPGSAESAARKTAEIWENELGLDADGLFRQYGRVPLAKKPHPSADLIVIQGSPRVDGNSSILAEWAVVAAQEIGMTVKVIYPHDMDIHCCIGCYQCYNAGTCVFQDDMEEIIDVIRGARLVIVCSPVYTNTVPAGLKLVIDRTQAYNAERTLFGGRTGQYGLVYSVAGRKGSANFTCITRVISAFFHSVGIAPAGEVLIDSADIIHDIRRIRGKEQAVREQVQRLLQS